MISVSLPKSELGSVGVTIRSDQDGRYFIADIDKNGPAFGTRLETGMEVVRIGGTAVRRMHNGFEFLYLGQKQGLTLDVLPDGSNTSSHMDSHGEKEKAAPHSLEVLEIGGIRGSKLSNLINTTKAVE